MRNYSANNEKYFRPLNHEVKQFHEFEVSSGGKINNHLMTDIFRKIKSSFALMEADMNYDEYKEYESLITSFSTQLDTDLNNTEKLWTWENFVKKLLQKSDISRIEIANSTGDGVRLFYKDIELNVSRTFLAVVGINNVVEETHLRYFVDLFSLNRNGLRKIDITSDSCVFTFDGHTEKLNIDDVRNAFINGNRGFIPMVRTADNNEENSDKTDKINTNLKIADNKNKGENIDKNVSFIHDAPIRRNDDGVLPTLGVGSLAFSVAEILNGMKEDKGSIFGVFGKWGRGKTFLINEIKKQELIKDNFFTIDFNAWKYQDAPASWAYLHMELYNYYFSGLKGCNKAKKIISFNLKKSDFLSPLFFVFLIVFTILWALIYSVLSLNQINITLFSLFGIPVFSALSNLFNAYNKHRKFIGESLEKYTKNKSFVEHLGLQHEIQNEIKELIKFCLNGSNKKILLIVDDIDRCPENKIIQIVDALRVMLDADDIKDKIVVLLAVDEEILKKSIKCKYSKLFSENDDKRIQDLTREYMDKVFLSGIRLGVLTNDDRASILSKVIKRKVDLNEFLPDSVIENDGDSEVNNDIKADNKNSNINDDTVKVSICELDNYEEKNMLSAIKEMDDITPRQINIFHFRYLFARNLLENLNERCDSKKLCNLIAEYTENYKKFNDDVLRKKMNKSTLEKVLEMVITY